jgi:SAM-dependent methyltransferase
VATCPICHSRNRSVFQAKHVKAAKCSNPLCGHIWALDVALGHGVQSIVDPDTPPGFFERRNREVIRGLVKRGLIKPGGRVLDFGAGDGHFIETLRNELPDLDIMAIEAAPEGRTRLQAMGFTTYDSVETVRGTFDAILLVEVIEHIDDPTAALRMIRARLRTGGGLFCTTPCGETRRGQRRRAAYETPEHIHFFTERSLALCFANAGFAPFKCETLNFATSRQTPLPARYLKDIARPILAKIFGHIHLTGFAFHPPTKNIAWARRPISRPR